MISYVEPGSAADEGGILPGDCLLSVNNQDIRDIFDYRFLTTDELVTLRLRGADGDEYEVEIEKDTYEDLGIEFENSMLDDDRGCCNGCIFCFIDQMPKGMRDTLYFKDDDTRLSFLTGNYVTLTNIPYKELDRIVRYRMSPINVSVHTTDPELRCKMLHHKGAGDIMQKLDVLRRGCITVNAQIVLCPDYNDGESLERTLKDLASLDDCVASVSVVPVGITKYREGLTPLRLCTVDECKEIIKTVERWQCKIFNERGTRFVYAADEIYIKAGIALPDYEKYDGFPQLENGVGMARLLDFEVCEYINSDLKRLRRLCVGRKPRRVTIATGAAAYDIIKHLAEYISSYFEFVSVEVYRIVNEFFGDTVTVAGLLTGRDIVSQLKNENLGEEMLITRNMLRAGEDILLDDMRLDELEKQLGVRVTPVDDSGKAFVDSIIGGME